MSHTFHVSEEQYADLAAYAEGINETPDWVFQAWVQGMIDWMDGGAKICDLMKARRSLHGK